MMKIGIFVGSAGSNSGGPERFEVELVRALAKQDKVNEYQVISLFNKAPDVIDVEQENFSYTVLKPEIRILSMLTSLPLCMSKNPKDIWHATYVPPVFSSQSYVFTLVCSSMFEHPEYYPPAIRARLLFLMNLAMRKAGLIICISDHIRQVVQERFAIPDEKLAVVHLGVNRSFKPVPGNVAGQFVNDTYGIDTPYFLFSGRWEPRKNILRILEAFAIFKKQTKSNIKMVFTGAMTWSAEEADAIIEKNNLHAHIVKLGKSPVDELPLLYAGATALVFPSLWEGFGLPIIEAMASGTPVITSNNSSMAEIGADAALLVDPYSIDEIAEAMFKIYSDNDLQQELVSKGLKRAADFDWMETGKQTLAVYNRFKESFKETQ